MLRVIGLAATILAIAACAPAAVPSAPASTSPSSGSPDTPVPSESASPPAGIDLSAVPMACIGLGAEDCVRIVAEVAELVPAGTTPTYLQVGPFGCPDTEGCPRTLLARPQGDITIEAGPGALSWHVTAAAGGADLTFEQQDAFGVLVAPSSQPPVIPGPRAFTLGHCGLWSGIDVGGSWWDPVGQVDGDHADAINAAEGTLAILDPDRATFTSKGGLTIQLVRHPGQKYLPLCQ
jgi:hypothetical protein